jgi:hypothetical protein
MPAGYMPAGYLYINKRLSTFAEIIGSFNPNAHWPLSDPSFSTTPGSITELIGGSNGVRDRMNDWAGGGTLEVTPRTDPFVKGGSP